jgi:parvulin-like peptidyl-prolyl isomerase
MIMNRIIVIALLGFIACGQNEQDVSPDEDQEIVVDEPKEQVHVAHILIMYEGATRAPATINRSKDEARAQSEALLERVNRGANFHDLAKLYSDCPSSKIGGDLNMIRRGDLAAPFEDVAFELKRGEVSGIVETEFGFHIIKRLGEL